jgi:hypothetical protein
MKFQSSVIDYSNDFGRSIVVEKVEKYKYKTNIQGNVNENFVSLTSFGLRRPSSKMLVLCRVKAAQGRNIGKQEFVFICISLDVDFLFTPLNQSVL